MIRGQEALKDIPGLELAGPVELRKLTIGAPENGLTATLRKTARDGVFDVSFECGTVSDFKAEGLEALPVILDDFSIENVRSIGWRDVTWQVSADGKASLLFYCDVIDLIDLERVS
ncbi:hypothetical protein FF098_011670 [Parvularcula flava]|uniref:Uncharacterized protein n=1 Tax=Aquisalinus luteolus TaxID=1566827 RepID=A0A8J3A7V2_9PROT|nr:hypothetical protein [Aquisalinus luteolus]NHK28566.1 hypothetical protein [Aquisalinus luteolus]GGH98859.1 hypothetical protein GCM10011355_23450 [Aquisalinus luteolus]